MKQAICLMISIVMVFSLTACTKSNTTAPSTERPTTSLLTPSPSEITPPATEPDPEAIIAERLSIYREIWRQLEFYKANGYKNFRFQGLFVSNAPKGNEGLKYCYEFLRSMDDLKPYLNEEAFSTFVPGYTLPEQTPEELLARFTIIEDVLVSMAYTTDSSSIGELRRNDTVLWRYNSKGQLVHIDQQDWGSMSVTWRPADRLYYNDYAKSELFYEYDENGELIAPWFAQDNKPHTPIIPTYDDSGRVILENCGNVTFSYTYNEQGDLSKVVMSRPSIFEDGKPLIYTTRSWVYSHQYDENGNIIRRMEQGYHDDDLFYTVTEFYYYDENGRVCRINKYVGSWDDIPTDSPAYSPNRSSIVYTYDQKGRILTKSNTTGGGLDANGTPIHEAILSTETYIYGDYYVFDEYEIDFPE